MFLFSFLKLFTTSQLGWPGRHSWCTSGFHLGLDDQTTPIASLNGVGLVSSNFLLLGAPFPQLFHKLFHFLFRYFHLPDKRLQAIHLYGVLLLYFAWGGYRNSAVFRILLPCVVCVIGFLLFGIVASSLRVMTKDGQASGYVVHSLQVRARSLTSSTDLSMEGLLINVFAFGMPTFLRKRMQVFFNLQTLRPLWHATEELGLLGLD